MNRPTIGAINWHCSEADASLILKIMLRAASLMSFEKRGADRMSVSMDLTACHLNGCPLDLESLLAAGKFDFVHDIDGITYHIDRKTGKLKDNFCPRYAAKVTS